MKSEDEVINYFVIGFTIEDDGRPGDMWGVRSFWRINEAEEFILEQQKLYDSLSEEGKGVNRDNLGETLVRMQQNDPLWHEGMLGTDWVILTAPVQLGNG